MDGPRRYDLPSMLTMAPPPLAGLPKGSMLARSDGLSKGFPLASCAGEPASLLRPYEPENEPSSTDEISKPPDEYVLPVPWLPGERGEPPEGRFEVARPTGVVLGPALGSAAGRCDDQPRSKRPSSFFAWTAPSVGEGRAAAGDEVRRGGPRRNESTMPEKESSSPSSVFD